MDYPVEGLAPYIRDSALEVITLSSSSPSSRRQHVSVHGVM